MHIYTHCKHVLHMYMQQVPSKYASAKRPVCTCTCSGRHLYIHTIKVLCCINIRSRSRLHMHMQPSPFKLVNLAGTVSTCTHVRPRVHMHTSVYTCTCSNASLRMHMQLTPFTNVLPTVLFAHAHAAIPSLHIYTQQASFTHAHVVGLIYIWTPWRLHFHMCTHAGSSMNTCIH